MPLDHVYVLSVVARANLNVDKPPLKISGKPKAVLFARSMLRVVGVVDAVSVHAFAPPVKVAALANITSP